jgi:hypothetical protein
MEEEGEAGGRERWRKEEWLGRGREGGGMV